MYCTCGLYGLNFFLCFCFCFCDKVQQLEQEKFSLEGAMQELGQVGFFFFFAFCPRLCSVLQLLLFIIYSNTSY